MKFLLLPLVFAVCGLCSAVEPAGQLLFDGKTLDGWEGNPKQWRVENGAITGEIPEGQSLERNEFLYWKGEVHDFDLTVEYRISGGPGANSGIQYRSERMPDGAAAAPVAALVKRDANQPGLERLCGGIGLQGGPCRQ